MPFYEHVFIARQDLSQAQVDALAATDLGDVEQAVLAGKQLDEGAEGLDAHDAAGVLLAGLGNLDDGLDALHAVPRLAECCALARKAS